MPGEQRENKKELAAAKLATGGTIIEAAEAAGVDQRTIYKWKADDAAFRLRIVELRTEAVSRALGRLSDSMCAAAEALAGMIKSRTATVKLRAARAVLELALRLRHETEFEERLAAVERALKGERDAEPDRAPESPGAADRAEAGGAETGERVG